MTMKLVIIESPYKGDVARNKRYLRACIRDCIFRRGESPYASHRMLTDALNDNDPEERATGIEAGLAWAHVRQPVFGGPPAEGYILRHNLAIHAFYIDLGYTNGMTLAQTRFDDEGVLYEERTLPPDDLFFTEPVSEALTDERLAEIRYSLNSTQRVLDPWPGVVQELFDEVCRARGVERLLPPGSGRVSQ